MEKWEYLTRFFEARVDKEIRNYIKEEFDKKPGRYSPESMIPELNELGEQGWEIVHMEPVARVGGKENVLFDNNYRWSNTYFCVLKRRKPGSYLPSYVLNLPAPQQAHQQQPPTPQSNTATESGD